jgi:hypothetical protein
MAPLASGHAPCRDPQCRTCSSKKSKGTQAQEVAKLIQEVTDLVDKKPDTAAKILAGWIEKPKATSRKKTA